MAYLIVGFQNPLRSGLKARQDDPDNWVFIPEFNLLPSDVRFQGFKHPIFRRGISPSTSAAIYEMLKAVRVQARSRFGTLAELRALKNEVMSRTSKTEIILTHDENFATRYDSFCYFVSQCLGAYSSDKARSVGSLSYAAAELTAMLTARPLDTDELKKIRSRMAQDGAIAKLANDPKQEDKDNVKDCWLRWLRTKGEFPPKEEFARQMLDKYGCSVDRPKGLKSAQVIARWCRLWETEHITLLAK